MGGGSREWQTYTVDLSGTFSKCRMTLPITMSGEVERVSSGALSPHLACRAITTGTYPPSPSLTTIIPRQFSEISQQTCDSSFRVIGLSCTGLRTLTACRRLKEHREMTKQSKVVSLQWGRTSYISPFILISMDQRGSTFILFRSCCSRFLNWRCLLHLVFHC